MPRQVFEPVSETSANPQLRPSVQALMSKLRTISVLKAKPDNAEFILNDLMYQFFYDEKKRPQALFRMMMRANSLWRMALGANDFASVTQMSYENGAMATDGQMVESASHEAPDVPPEVAAKSTEFLLADALESQILKEGVSTIISNHRLVNLHTQLCTCGREPEDHSTHVRIRIWRFLKNEFTTKEV